MSSCRSASSLAIAFIAAGVPQTLAGSVDATTLEGAKQTIALGPMASQEAIKQFGTNGGGFFNANAAHPFENPNAWTNLLQIWALLAVSFGLVITFGKMVGSEKQGWAFFKIIAVLLVERRRDHLCGGKLRQSAADPARPRSRRRQYGRQGNPLRHRFVLALCGGDDRHVLRRASTPCTIRFTPLGGLIPMFLIQLGEILPGGVGSGLYGMVVFAILSVFIAGLMVGRTPEFLGKKIESREIKLAMLAVLILPLSILGFSAVAAVLPVGPVEPRQQRPARPVGNSLRLYLVDRQQRLRLRRAQRQYAMV